MDEYKKFAVEKYLEQVKILTALATTLLLTPNVLLTLSKEASVREDLADALPRWKEVLVGTNVAFILVILATYFIYSSVVGSADTGELNVYRPATRVLSIAQLVLTIVGCVGLLVLFAHAT